MPSAADPRRVEDPELRPNEERHGNRREDGELAEHGWPLQRDRGRVEGQGSRRIRDGLGHHGADRDGRGDGDGQACRENRPPGGGEPPRQEVHGHGRQCEAERVGDLEPLVRRVDAPRQANDGREQGREERAEAKMLSPEREALAPGQRRGSHRVELLVRVDARAVDTRRQQRVEEKRADDDRAEHEQRPVPLVGRPSGVPLGRSRLEGRCGLELRCHARAMVDGGSATRATRRPVLRRVTLWSSAASAGRPPTLSRYCRDRCR